MIQYWCIIGFIFLLQFPESSCASHPKCNVIFHYNFENCRYLHYTNLTKPPLSGTGIDCRNKSVCEREFNVTFIRLMPYYIMKALIPNMLSYCCGRCANLTVVNDFPDMSSGNISSLATADFVYPILGPTSADELYGFYFIPIINVPSACYITWIDESPSETLLDLVTACANLWPLLVICLLMALISGFIAWIMETWVNVEEFPRPFYIGLFEGFWWSFVSMTTVGYGDKTPKTWPARIFSVFWILIGIAICSLLTASLTTEITTAITPTTPEIGGKKIGWLKHRLYEAAIIAQHGGTIHVVEDDNFFSGIKKLLQLLKNGTVQGIVLDTYAFNTFKFHTSNPSDKLHDKDISRIIYNKTKHIEVTNKGEKLSFGVLVRHSVDNYYFRKYFTDNQLQMEACIGFQLNLIIENETTNDDLFSTDAGLFWPFFAATSGILAAIICFGIIFELHRRKYLCRSNAVAEQPK